MYATLVLSAGNMHGLMYIGAYQWLLENNLVASLKNIVGCSSGAIMGLMIALGLTPKEMREVIAEIMVADGIPSFSVKDMLKLWKHMGVMDGDFKIDIVRKILRKKIDQTDISFLDLAKRTGKNLVVVGSNITLMCGEEFSLEKTPNMSVLEALNITTTMSFMCFPVRWHGSMYLDGGMFEYVPVSRTSDINALLLLCDFKRHDEPKTFMDMLKVIIDTYQVNIVNEQCKDWKNVCRLTSHEEPSCFRMKLFSERTRITESMLDNFISEGYRQCKESQM